MKKLVPILAAAVLLAAFGEPTLTPVPDDNVRGVALGLFASDPSYDYGMLVDEIRGRGSTDVLVVVQWTQPNVWSSDIDASGPATAKNETVLRTIQQVNAAGMRATVMPIVRLQERTPTQWRGTIAADPDAWFDAYGTHLETLARTAETAGANRLLIGSELASLQKHDDHWRALIKRTRGVYSGTLSYSANWDAFEDVPFWDALDEVGVTGYFPVTHDDAWRAPKAKFEALRKRTKKPVIITEIGYPSHELAAQRPWDQFANSKPAPALQAKLYKRFCAEVEFPRDVDGAFFWNWFGFGGPGEVSFTPRGKPAAAVMESCLRRTTGEGK